MCYDFSTISDFLQMAVNTIIDLAARARELSNAIVQSDGMEIAKDI